jgi:DUF1365 family protein
MRSAIYEGEVTHARIHPARHSFRYRVFSLLLDIDELDALSARSRFFARNRAALLSFHDKDHGDGGNLRAWVTVQLATANIVADGPVQVLCYPRLFGYVFNPLSVWFCHCADGALVATIYEVHNTFGERHTYVLPVTGAAIEQSCCKDFHVSPFLSLNCNYTFRIAPPGQNILVSIRETEHGAPVLNAAFTGIRQPFTDRNLLSAAFRHPLMTLKVFAAIHFEALRLWLKRVPTHAHIRALPAKP